MNSGNFILQPVGDSRVAGNANYGTGNFLTLYSELIRQSEGMLTQSGMNHEGESNWGITAWSGATSTEIAGAIYKHWDSHNPDGYLVHLGYNDRASTNSWSADGLIGLKKNIARISQYALKKGAVCFLVSEIGHRDINTSGTVQLAAYNRWLAAWCDHHPHCIYIPVNHVVSNPASGGLHSSYTDSGDGVHLNYLGAYEAGRFALDVMKPGGTIGLDPYFVCSNKEVFTVTDPVDGAALNIASGNPIGLNGTTGWTTLGGMTLTTTTPPSGSRCAGNLINAEKTADGVRYFYADQSSPTAGFWATGEKLRVSARVYVQTDNVAVEWALERGSGDNGNRLRHVTTSQYGDILTMFTVPASAPTRYRVICTVRDFNTFSTNQTIQMGQATIVNYSRLETDVMRYALFE